MHRDWMDHRDLTQSLLPLSPKRLHFNNRTERKNRCEITKVLLERVNEKLSFLLNYNVAVITSGGEMV